MSDGWLFTKERSLARAIAESLRDVGADSREVSYFWNFCNSLNGDDHRNDAEVIAKAGFNIDRKTRCCHWDHMAAFALLPEPLRNLLLSCADSRDLDVWSIP